MAKRVSPELLEKLRAKTGLSASQVYKLIGEKVRNTALPRHLAAIALANERGVSISRFADDDDLATIRGVARGAAPPPVIAPAAAQPTVRPRAGLRKTAKRKAGPPRRGTSVFVVHGRNTELAKQLFRLLRALGLKPMEWVEAIRRTGQPTPYVGTILDVAFRDAAAVVVLMTPDDVARLRPPYRKKHDPAYEAKLTGQARPNVLFEAGMAFGRNPASTVLIEVGELRPFSDVGGRHVVRLGNDPASRTELATKLANAGCNVDTSGTAWQEEGDFRLKAQG